MVIFFGPAGAGKSVQGQMLAARHGWRWLSAGQLMRDTRDHDLLKHMSTGELVDDEKVNAIVGRALAKAHDIDHVILDGFPRHVPQAQWLLSSRPEHGWAISLVVVIEVSKEELIRRLQLRGRADDTPRAIEERLHIYRHEVEPIIDFFNQHHVPVAHVNGVGTVGEVHDRVEAELQACSLV